MLFELEAVSKDLEQPSAGTLELVPLNDEGNHGTGTISGAQSHEELTDESNLIRVRKTRRWMVVTWTVILGVCIGVTSDYYASNQGSPGVASGPPPIVDSSEAVVLVGSTTMGGEDEIYSADKELAKEGRQSQSKPVALQSKTEGNSYLDVINGCGGSLIAPNVVLTPIECGSNVGKIVKVGAGDRKSGNPKAVLVSEVAMGKFKLLRLSKDVDSQSHSALHSLDDKTFDPHGNEQLTEVGFLPRSASPRATSGGLPKVTLGAYYYPWHAGDSHGGDYIRESLNQKPLLGEYDDRDPKVIAQHLEWSERANIGLWVTSWWGPNTREDTTTRLNIMKHPDLLDSDHKIALFYETFGRILKNEDYSLHSVEPDVEFMCSHYFSHPNYFHIDGKPVVYVYLTRLLEDLGNSQQVLELMRQTAKATCGKEIYIIGDHIFGPPLPHVVEDTQMAFDLLDGVTNYDVYGSIAKSVGSQGGYIQEDDVRRYYEVEQSEWKSIVNQLDCAYIPSVSPGYNDLAVPPEEHHIPLSRALFGQAPGSLFQTAVTSARSLVDSSASNVLMINSFNEWHEDTQIEPVAGESSASTPFNLTYGLSHHGYGTLYLDILRSATRS